MSKPHNDSSASDAQSERVPSSGQWGPRSPRPADSSVPSPTRVPSSLLWTARGLLGVALLAITYLSLTPAGPSVGLPHADKLMHLLAYGVVAGLAVMSGMGIFRSFVLALIWGLGIEALQGVMSIGRDASWMDALANMIGAAMGAGLAAMVTRTLKSRLA